MSSFSPEAHLELPSSQEPPISDLTMNLSPPRLPIKRRERRDPSVTPRKFTRFFTPRSHGSLPKSRARKILNDITKPALNRATQSSPVRPYRIADGQDSIGFTPVSKRRKVFHTPEATRSKLLSFGGVDNGDSIMADVMSSPCERAVKDSDNIEEEDDESEGEEDIPRPNAIKRIVRLQDRGLGGQLLNRSIGTSTYHRYAYPVNDWRDHTAGFHSKPEDVHVSMSLMSSRQGSRVIPFCARGLNREDSTLVALGDEEGHVRLLDTARDGKPGFDKDCFNARIHANAIIDMVFSTDDSRLATASGDQSARVYDMHKQVTISILGNHSASLKQVRWQPGSSNDNILATSSRDGSIQLWDLRCNTSDTPVYRIYAPLESDPIHHAGNATKIRYNQPTRTIYDGHKPQSKPPQFVLGGSDQFLRPGEQMPRSGDVSVTAIQFLPAGREHLLISGSEADSSVKLWDIRQNSYRCRPKLPVASTAQPQSHNKFRHFGINSINLSGDGSRFYTLCKDNTVYAYSTEHLMLGYAPELSTPARSFTQTSNVAGLGPLYGFRHPKLHATTFYVKSALRKAQNGKCEMLAVGSSDGYAILFPTDERYLPLQTESAAHLNTPATPLPISAATLESRPALCRAGSGLDGSLLISTNGTALERGHEDKEVGSMTWTSSGDLVTVGDDFLVRCWKEDRDEAKNLRVGGEEGGRRWACGWADTGEGYDDEEAAEL